MQTFRGDALVWHRVRYLDPSGALICTKELEYGEHAFAPAYRLDDLRDGYFEGARREGAEYVLFRGRGDRVEHERMPWSEALVADAGFDRFVLARLPELLQQRVLRMRLAVAGRLDWLHMRMQAVRVDAALHQVELRVVPDSALRFFVAPIELLYDTRSGHLLRYVGISNIRNSSGDLHDARIEFPASHVRPAGFAGAP